MRQYDDKSFQVILRRVRKDLLNDDNIAIQKSKVIVIILTMNPDNQMVMI